MTLTMELILILTLILILNLILTNYNYHDLFSKLICSYFPLTTELALDPSLALDFEIKHVLELELDLNLKLKLELDPDHDHGLGIDLDIANALEHDPELDQAQCIEISRPTFKAAMFIIYFLNSGTILNSLNNLSNPTVNFFSRSFILPSLVFFVL